MSGGDGGGFFDDPINSLVPSKGLTFKGLIDGAINGYLQAMTVGTVGYKDGKIGKGATVELAEEVGKSTVEGVKTVTGAKAAEDANALALEQFELTKKQAEEERQNAIQQKGVQQIQMSQLAGAARRAGTTSNPITLGSTGEDFLGL